MRKIALFFMIATACSSMWAMSRTETKEQAALVADRGDVKAAADELSLDVGDIKQPLTVVFHFGQRIASQKITFNNSAVAVLHTLLAFQQFPGNENREYQLEGLFKGFGEGCDDRHVELFRDCVQAIVAGKDKKTAALVDVGRRLQGCSFSVFKVLFELSEFFGLSESVADDFLVVMLSALPNALVGLNEQERSDAYDAIGSFLKVQNEHNEKKVKDKLLEWCPWIFLKAGLGAFKKVDVQNKFKLHLGGLESSRKDWRIGALNALCNKFACMWWLGVGDAWRNTLLRIFDLEKGGSFEANLNPYDVLQVAWNPEGDRLAVLLYEPYRKLVLRVYQQLEGQWIHSQEDVVLVDKATNKNIFAWDDHKYEHFKISWNKEGVEILTAKGTAYLFVEEHNEWCLKNSRKALVEKLEWQGNGFKDIIWRGDKKACYVEINYNYHDHYIITLDNFGGSRSMYKIKYNEPSKDIYCRRPFWCGNDLIIPELESYCLHRYSIKEGRSLHSTIVLPVTGEDARVFIPTNKTFASINDLILIYVTRGATAKKIQFMRYQDQYGWRALHAEAITERHPYFDIFARSEHAVGNLFFFYKGCSLIAQDTNNHSFYHFDFGEKYYTSSLLDILKMIVHEKFQDTPAAIALQKQQDAHNIEVGQEAQEKARKLAEQEAALNKQRAEQKAATAQALADWRALPWYKKAQRYAKDCFMAARKHPVRTLIRATAAAVLYYVGLRFLRYK